jgi:hypothetical protein
MSISRKKAAIRPVRAYRNADRATTFRATPLVGRLRGIDIDSLVDAAAEKMNPDVPPLLSLHFGGGVAAATQVKMLTGLKFFPLFCWKGIGMRGFAHNPALLLPIGPN